MTPSIPLFILMLCLPSLGLTHFAEHRRSNALWRRKASNIPSDGFFNPTNGNGSFLTMVADTFPAGLGEPINIILTTNSDAAVLVDQQNDGGLRNYFQAVGFAGECLGQHSGSDQAANLGDGNGYLNETAVIRWDYGDPALGTCEETVDGGNHFRYWVQNGKDADSGAIFMAMSYEEPIAEGHDIIDNGYNLARDWFIGNATGNQTIPTSNLTNSSTYTGQASASGYTYQTNVLYVSGFLPNTSSGINHFLTVGDGQNAVDGLVALMTVTITQKPSATTSASSSSSIRSIVVPPMISTAVLPVLLYLLYRL